MSQFEITRSIAAEEQQIRAAFSPLNWKELLHTFYSYKKYPSFNAFLMAQGGAKKQNEGAIYTFFYALRLGSSGTLETYAQNICAFLNFTRKQFWSINVDDINHYIDNLVQKRRMKNTLKLHVASIKSFFKKLKGAGLATLNPAEFVPTPKISASAKVSAVMRKSLSFDQVEAIRNYLENNAPTRDLCIFYLLARSGLRVSELCSLKWKNMLLVHGLWALQIQGKGDKERLVILSQQTSEYLLLYREYEFNVPSQTIESPGIDELPIFSHLHDKNLHLTRDSINKMFLRYTEKMKIRRFSPHALRHTCFTNLSQIGTSITDIKKVAGHENINTTAMYIDAGDMMAGGAQNFNRVEQSGKTDNCPKNMAPA